MTGLIRATKDKFINDAVAVLDDKYNVIKEEIKTIRKEAKAKIGTSTKSAGEARDLMYKKLNDLTNKDDKELAIFKGEIRCPAKPEQERQQYRQTGHSNERGWPRGSGRGYRHYKHRDSRQEPYYRR